MSNPIHSHNEYKAFIDPQDLHLKSCNLSFKQGAILRPLRQEGDRAVWGRVFWGFYREYTLLQKPVMFLLFPFQVLNVFLYGSIYGPNKCMGDPTLLFPRGRCYECGTPYGYQRYQLPELRELFGEKR